MPKLPTYPGVYIQETPTPSHAIIAAPTDIAAFIGYSHPLKTDSSLFGVPTEIFGFLDYQRLYGGFVRSAAFARQASTQATGQPVGDLAAAVNQFFLNGGRSCHIVALDAAAALLSPNLLPTIEIGGITFRPRELTDTFYALSVSVTPAQPDGSLADVVIQYGPASGGPAAVETYRRVSLTDKIGSPAIDDPNYIGRRIGSADAPQSQFVTIEVGANTAFPPQATFATMGISYPDETIFYDASVFVSAMAAGSRLDQLTALNLLVLPGIQDPAVLAAAIQFCERKNVFLVMDPPILDSADGSTAGFPHMIQTSLSAGTIPRSRNAALYFPYLASPDPFTGAAVNSVTGLPNEIPPSGSVAGLICATDNSRGVWKAPAGMQAVVRNTTGVVGRGKMNDVRQGVLNLLDVNCLRDFPNVGTVVFGSRTLSPDGDAQWQYVPVRRMALFLEQTLLTNLEWVIFEPNASPLWIAITASIQTFMLNLFKQGAFQGTTPKNAFFVKCDAETTTQADIDQGIVNIVVGFAPLKPAEFVILTIAQLAGQSSTAAQPDARRVLRR